MRNWQTDRAKAIQWARTVLNDNLVIVDTETTGLTSTDEVVQLGVIGVKDGQPLVLLDALVRPVRATMHPKATAASGITDAMLKTAPTIERYWDVLQHLFTGKTIVAYNAAFDEPKLRHSLRAVGHVFPFEIECAMLQYGAFDGEWNDYYGNYRWHKLTEACRSMNIPIKDAHVASGDCLMTFQLIKKMAESES